MVHPNMATMFGLIASDVVMTAECLRTLLGYAVNHSFNCVTVDGDTSTNDACAIVATQVSGHETISDPASLEAQIFAALYRAYLMISQKCLRVTARVQRNLSG